MYTIQYYVITQAWRLVYTCTTRSFIHLYSLQLYLILEMYFKLCYMIFIIFFLLICTNVYLAVGVEGYQCAHSSLQQLFQARGDPYSRGEPPGYLKERQQIYFYLSLPLLNVINMSKYVFLINI